MIAILYWREIIICILVASCLWLINLNQDARYEAKEYMRHDLIEFEHTVNSSVKVPLNQNQFDALVSLAYNIGSNAFKSSTLVKKLNTNDYQGAADQFNVWVNAGGKRMQGLVNRRDKEKLLFLS